MQSQTLNGGYYRTKGIHIMPRMSDAVRKYSAKSAAAYALAAGIVVAIEAVVVYNYFMARLSRVALELKLMAEEYVELLREQKPDPRSKSGEHRLVEAVAAVKPTPTEA